MLKCSHCRISRRTYGLMTLFYTISFVYLITLFPSIAYSSIFLSATPDISSCEPYDLFIPEWETQLHDSTVKLPHGDPKSTTAGTSPCHVPRPGGPGGTASHSIVLSQAPITDPCSPPTLSCAREIHVSSGTVMSVVCPPGQIAIPQPIFTCDDGKWMDVEGDPLELPSDLPSYCHNPCMTSPSDQLKAAIYNPEICTSSPHPSSHSEHKIGSNVALSDDNPPSQEHVWWNRTTVPYLPSIVSPIVQVTCQVPQPPSETQESPPPFLCVEPTLHFPSTVVQKYIRRRPLGDEARRAALTSISQTTQPLQLLTPLHDVIGFDLPITLRNNINTWDKQHSVGDGTSSNIYFGTTSSLSSPPIPVRDSQQYQLQRLYSSPISFLLSTLSSIAPNLDDVTPEELLLFLFQWYPFSSMIFTSALRQLSPRSKPTRGQILNTDQGFQDALSSKWHSPIFHPLFDEQFPDLDTPAPPEFLQQIKDDPVILMQPHHSQQVLYSLGRNDQQNEHAPDVSPTHPMTESLSSNPMAYGSLELCQLMFTSETINLLGGAPNNHVRILEDYILSPKKKLQLLSLSSNVLNQLKKLNTTPRTDDDIQQLNSLIEALVRDRSLQSFPHDVHGGPFCYWTTMASSSDKEPLSEDHPTVFTETTTMTLRVELGYNTTLPAGSSLHLNIDALQRFYETTRIVLGHSEDHIFSQMDEATPSAIGVVTENWNYPPYIALSEDSQGRLRPTSTDPTFTQSVGINSPALMEIETPEEDGCDFTFRVDYLLQPITIHADVSNTLDLNHAYTTFWAFEALTNRGGHFDEHHVHFGYIFQSIMSAMYTTSPGNRVNMEQFYANPIELPPKTDARYDPSTPQWATGPQTLELPIDFVMMLFPGTTYRIHVKVVTMDILPTPPNSSEFTHYLTFCMPDAQSIADYHLELQSSPTWLQPFPRYTSPHPGQPHTEMIDPHDNSTLTQFQFAITFDNPHNSLFGQLSSTLTSHFILDHPCFHLAGLPGYSSKEMDPLYDQAHHYLETNHPNADPISRTIYNIDHGVHLFPHIAALSTYSNDRKTSTISRHQVTYSSIMRAIWQPIVPTISATPSMDLTGTPSSFFRFDLSSLTTYTSYHLRLAHYFGHYHLMSRHSLYSAKEVDDLLKNMNHLVWTHLTTDDQTQDDGEHPSFISRLLPGPFTHSLYFLLPPVEFISPLPPTLIASPITNLTFDFSLTYIHQRNTIHRQVPVYYVWSCFYIIDTQLNPIDLAQQEPDDGGEPPHPTTAPWELDRHYDPSRHAAQNCWLNPERHIHTVKNITNAHLTEDAFSPPNSMFLQQHAHRMVIEHGQVPYLYSITGDVVKFHPESITSLCVRNVSRVYFDISILVGDSVFDSIRSSVKLVPPSHAIAPFYITSTIVDGTDEEPSPLIQSSPSLDDSPPRKLIAFPPSSEVRFLFHIIHLISLPNMKIDRSITSNYKLDDLLQLSMHPEPITIRDSAHIIQDNANMMPPLSIATRAIASHSLLDNESTSSDIDQRSLSPDSILQIPDPFSSLLQIPPTSLSSDTGYALETCLFQTSLNAGQQEIWKHFFFDIINTPTSTNSFVYNGDIVQDDIVYMQLTLLNWKELPTINVLFPRPLWCFQFSFNVVKNDLLEICTLESLQPEVSSTGRAYPGLWRLSVDCLAYYNYYEDNQRNQAIEWVVSPITRTNIIPSLDSEYREFTFGVHLRSSIVLPSGEYLIKAKNPTTNTTFFARRTSFYTVGCPQCIVEILDYFANAVENYTAFILQSSHALSPFLVHFLDVLPSESHHIFVTDTSDELSVLTYAYDLALLALLHVENTFLSVEVQHDLNSFLPLILAARSRQLAAIINVNGVTFTYASMISIQLSRPPPSRMNTPQLYDSQMKSQSTSSQIYAPYQQLYSPQMLALYTDAFSLPLLLESRERDKGVSYWLNQLVASFFLNPLYQSHHVSNDIAHVLKNTQNSKNGTDGKSLSLDPQYLDNIEKFIISFVGMIQHHIEILTNQSDAYPPTRHAPDVSQFRYLSKLFSLQHSFVTYVLSLKLSIQHAQSLQKVNAIQDERSLESRHATRQHLANQPQVTLTSELVSHYVSYHTIYQDLTSYRDGLIPFPVQYEDTVASNRRPPSLIILPSAAIIVGLSGVLHIPILYDNYESFSIYHLQVYREKNTSEPVQPTSLHPSSPNLDHYPHYKQVMYILDDLHVKDGIWSVLITWPHQDQNGVSPQEVAGRGLVTNYCTWDNLNAFVSSSHADATYTALAVTCASSTLTGTTFPTSNSIPLERMAANNNPNEQFDNTDYLNLLNTQTNGFGQGIIQFIPNRNLLTGLQFYQINGVYSYSSSTSKMYRLTVPQTPSSNHNISIQSSPLPWIDNPTIATSTMNLFGAQSFYVPNLQCEVLTVGGPDHSRCLILGMTPAHFIVFAQSSGTISVILQPQTTPLFVYLVYVPFIFVPLALLFIVVFIQRDSQITKHALIYAAMRWQYGALQSHSYPYLSYTYGQTYAKKIAFADSKIYQPLPATADPSHRPNDPNDDSLHQLQLPHQGATPHILTQQCVECGKDVLKVYAFEFTTFFNLREMKRFYRNVHRYYLWFTQSLFSETINDRQKRAKHQPHTYVYAENHNHANTNPKKAARGDDMRTHVDQNLLQNHRCLYCTIFFALGHHHSLFRLIYPQIRSHNGVSLTLTALVWLLSLFAALSLTSPIIYMVDVYWATLLTTLITGGIQVFLNSLLHRSLRHRIDANIYKYAIEVAKYHVTGFSPYLFYTQPSFYQHILKRTQDNYRWLRSILPSFIRESSVAFNLFGFALMDDYDGDYDIHSTHTGDTIHSSQYSDDTISIEDDQSLDLSSHTGSPTIDPKQPQSFDVMRKPPLSHDLPPKPQLTCDPDGPIHINSRLTQEMIAAASSKTLSTAEAPGALNHQMGQPYEDQSNEGESDIKPPRRPSFLSSSKHSVPPYPPNAQHPRQKYQQGHRDRQLLRHQLQFRHKQRLLGLTSISGVRDHNALSVTSHLFHWDDFADTSVVAPLAPFNKVPSGRDLSSHKVTAASSQDVTNQEEPRSKQPNRFSLGLHLPSQSSSIIDHGSVHSVKYPYKYNIQPNFRIRLIFDLSTSVFATLMALPPLPFSVPLLNTLYIHLYAHSKHYNVNCTCYSAPAAYYQCLAHHPHRQPQHQDDSRTIHIDHLQPADPVSSSEVAHTHNTAISPAWTPSSGIFIPFDFQSDENGWKVPLRCKAETCICNGDGDCSNLHLVSRLAFLTELKKKITLLSHRRRQALLYNSEVNRSRINAHWDQMKETRMNHSLVQETIATNGNEKHLLSLSPANHNSTDLATDQQGSFPPSDDTKIVSLSQLMEQYETQLEQYNKDQQYLDTFFAQLEKHDQELLTLYTELEELRVEMDRLQGALHHFEEERLQAQSSFKFQEITSTIDSYTVQYLFINSQAQTKLAQYQQLESYLDLFKQEYNQRIHIHQQNYYMLDDMYRDYQQRAYEQEEAKKQELLRQQQQQRALLEQRGKNRRRHQIQTNRYLARFIGKDSIIESCTTYINQDDIEDFADPAYPANALHPANDDMTYDHLDDDDFWLDLIEDQIYHLDALEQVEGHQNYPKSISSSGDSTIDELRLGTSSHSHSDHTQHWALPSLSSMDMPQGTPSNSSPEPNDSRDPRDTAGLTHHHTPTMNRPHSLPSDLRSSPLPQPFGPTTNQHSSKTPTHSTRRRDQLADVIPSKKHVSWNETVYVYHGQLGELTDLLNSHQPRNSKHSMQSYGEYDQPHASLQDDHEVMPRVIQDNQPYQSNRKTPHVSWAPDQHMRPSTPQRDQIISLIATHSYHENDSTGDGNGPISFTDINPSDTDVVHAAQNSQHDFVYEHSVLTAATLSINESKTKKLPQDLHFLALLSAHQESPSLPDGTEQLAADDRSTILAWAHHLLKSVFKPTTPNNVSDKITSAELSSPPSTSNHGTHQLSSPVKPAHLADHFYHDMVEKAKKANLSDIYGDVSRFISPLNSYIPLTLPSVNHQDSLVNSAITHYALITAHNHVATTLPTHMHQYYGALLILNRALLLAPHALLSHFGHHYPLSPLPFNLIATSSHEEKCRQAYDAQRQQLMMMHDPNLTHESLPPHMRKAFHDHHSPNLNDGFPHSQFPRVAQSRDFNDIFPSLPLWIPYTIFFVILLALVLLWVVGIRYVDEEVRPIEWFVVVGLSIVCDIFLISPLLSFLIQVFQPVNSNLLHRYVRQCQSIFVHSYMHTLDTFPTHLKVKLTQYCTSHMPYTTQSFPPSSDHKVDPKHNVSHSLAISTEQLVNEMIEMINNSLGVQEAISRKAQQSRSLDMNQGPDLNGSSEHQQQYLPSRDPDTARRVSKDDLKAVVETSLCKCRCGGDDLESLLILTNYIYSSDEHITPKRRVFCRHPRVVPYSRRNRQGTCANCGPLTQLHAPTCPKLKGVMLLFTIHTFASSQRFNPHMTALIWRYLRLLISDSVTTSHATVSSYLQSGQYYTPPADWVASSPLDSISKSGTLQPQSSTSEPQNATQLNGLPLSSFSPLDCTTIIANTIQPSSQMLLHGRSIMKSSSKTKGLGSNSPYAKHYAHACCCDVVQQALEVVPILLHSLTHLFMQKPPMVMYPIQLCLHEPHSTSYLQRKLPQHLTSLKRKGRRNPIPLQPSSRFHSIESVSLFDYHKQCTHDITGGSIAPRQQEAPSRHITTTPPVETMVNIDLTYFENVMIPSDTPTQEVSDSPSTMTMDTNVQPENGGLSASTISIAPESEACGNELLMTSQKPDNAFELIPLNRASSMHPSERFSMSSLSYPPNHLTSDDLSPTALNRQLPSTSPKTSRVSLIQTPLSISDSSGSSHFFSLHNTQSSIPGRMPLHPPRLPSGYPNTELSTTTSFQSLRENNAQLAPIYDVKTPSVSPLNMAPPLTQYRAYRGPLPHFQSTALMAFNTPLHDSTLSSDTDDDSNIESQ